MEAWMAFVSIMAIVAIVLVAGGVIAFIGHMIIGAFDNRKDAPVSSKEVLDYSEYKQLEQGRLAVEETKEFDFKAIEEAKKEIQEEDFKLDIDADDKDADLEDIENRLKAQAGEKVEEPIAKVEDVATVVETAEAVKEDDDLDLDNLLDEISNDVISEEQDNAKEENAPKMSDELSAYSIDNILNGSDEDDDVVDSDDEEELPVEEAEEAVVEDTKHAQEIEDLRAQLADLNRQLEEARTAKVEVVTLDMTEEECESRIEVLEERLKNVKKDYKVNMKEYRPLKKVMNDLERYQTKLRRKEAIVAKKKVALYGVNNYVDIDKEKAEKLANELELLDGLRLSVSHCEEVINANKDRYPILEHTNQILEDQISHIEADLETTRATLQKIRDKKGEGENK